MNDINFIQALDTNLKIAEEEYESEIEFTLDVSDCDILGVYDKFIFIRIKPYEHDDVVLRIEERVFLKMWKGWLKGKKNYCERYNHFCGVMGYYIPEDIEVTNAKISIADWNEQEGEYQYNQVPMIIVKTWSNEPDFEHG